MRQGGNKRKPTHQLSPDVKKLKSNNTKPIRVEKPSFPSGAGGIIKNLQAGKLLNGNILPSPAQNKKQVTPMAAKKSTRTPSTLDLLPISTKNTKQLRSEAKSLLHARSHKESRVTEPTRPPLQILTKTTLTTTSHSAALPIAHVQPIVEEAVINNNDDEDDFFSLLGDKVWTDDERSEDDINIAAGSEISKYPELSVEDLSYFSTSGLEYDVLIDDDSVFSQHEGRSSSQRDIFSSAPSQTPNLFSQSFTRRYGQHEVEDKELPDSVLVSEDDNILDYYGEEQLPINVFEINTDCTCFLFVNCLQWRVTYYF